MRRFAGDYDLNRVDDWTILARETVYDANAIAKLLQVSTHTLRRYCRETLGRSLQDWLNEQRMIAAPYLLREYRFVRRVSIELGFKHVSNFSACFKRCHGLSPSAYLEKSGPSSRFVRQK